MKELTLRKIAEACHGTVAPEAETVTVTGVQSDSRRVRPGDLFVAIKGEKADGHDFVAMAASLGAKAALVARPVEAPIPTILVDTIRAYGDPAAYQSAGITVIGITGSVGRATPE
ncbi:MAG: Mur ligase domain-containing protein [Oscillospiraceae bacterium]